LAIDVRHDRTNKDSDEYSSDDKETTQRFNGWKRPVHEQDNKTATPYADKVGHEDLPSLDREVRVE
jgi:hypothetical protein